MTTEGTPFIDNRELGGFEMPKPKPPKKIDLLAEQVLALRAEFQQQNRLLYELLQRQQQRPAQQPAPQDAMSSSVDVFARMLTAFSTMQSGMKEEIRKDFEFQRKLAADVAGGLMPTESSEDEGFLKLLGGMMQPAPQPAPAVLPPEPPPLPPMPPSPPADENKPLGEPPK